MTNKNVKLKNRIGEYLLPYTDNIPAASTSTAGKVKLDSSPISGSDNAITSGAVYTALSDKLSISGTAEKATADASGNTITTTYATKTELSTLQNSIPADSNLVHKTGDENIYGRKSFYNDITYFAQTNNNAGVEVQSNSVSYIRLHIPNSVFIALGCRVSEEVLYVTSGDMTRFAPIYAGYNTHNNCCMLNYNFQVVSALPANPDSNVYYFIPE